MILRVFDDMQGLTECLVIWPIDYILHNPRLGFSSFLTFTETWYKFILSYS
jgi:hypothetical protein